MKKIFISFLQRTRRENEGRVFHTALNRDRLIKFSHKLRKSNAHVPIPDYSVKNESLAKESSGTLNVASE